MEIISRQGHKETIKRLKRLLDDISAEEEAIGEASYYCSLISKIEKIINKLKTEGLNKK